MSKIEFKKPVMTGISYMIPMIVAGGILGALAKGLGDYNISTIYDTSSWATPFTGVFGALNEGWKPSNGFISVTSGFGIIWYGFWWAVNMLSSYAMSFAVAIMAAYIAFAICGRPGIVPGLIIGYACTQSRAGFIGGLVMGFVIGYLINWMKTWKVPKWCEGLMPVLIIPLLSTFICGMLFVCILMKPMAFVMDVLQAWIVGLNGGSKFLLGAIIGGCMGFDMGGPINKTASMSANALAADGILGPQAAKIVAGMTPPCGIFISTLVAPKKFTKTEKETAMTALPMGLCYITEGVLPFAAADPLRFIPCSVIGSALAGGIALAAGVETAAAHGGIFVFPMMANPLMEFVALIVGSLVTGVAYAIIKKGAIEEVEEEIVDLDIDIQM